MLFASRLPLNCRRFMSTLPLKAALILSSVSLAQTSAPVRLSPADSPFSDVPGARWVRLEGTNGTRFLTAILRPEGPGPFPVVVVLHGSNGLTRSYMAVAQDVARAGFLVVFGCWQAGEAPGPGNELCSEATPQAAWVADPAAHCGKELISLARGLPGAIAGSVGLYGLSRGGHAALWAASTGAGVQAVVVDAPAHSPNITPAPSKPLTVLAGLTTPLLLMHGTKDSVIAVEQSREYERAALALGKQLEVAYFEGAGHMASVAPESQADARKRAIAFFREHLSH